MSEINFLYFGKYFGTFSNYDFKIFNIQFSKFAKQRIIVNNTEYFKIIKYYIMTKISMLYVPQKVNFPIYCTVLRILLHTKQCAVKETGVIVIEIWLQ